ncbi:MAG: hypothetical protein IT168_08195 [Bryobacterales bacterium]|nr:hypothetical protein [Bryobacterales bacterium]
MHVPADFYAGPGRVWLARYRIILCLQHLILLLAFAVPVLSGRLNDLPIMAPVDVASFFLLIGGFVLFARHKLGTHPPQLSAVAASLHPRRLADYISWPVEAAMALLIAGCWIVLLLSGAGNIDWQMPIAHTYAIFALLPGKIVIVRNGFPIPPDRPDAHAAWSEAGRRHSLRVMDIMRWYLTTILVAWTLRHYILPPELVLPLQVLMAGVSIAYLVVLISSLTRGAQRIKDLGHGLRPPGSWATPFKPARATIPGGLAWGVLYCLGLVAILVVFRR